MKIRFTKMQGAGNDYIYVNTFRYPLTDPERLSELWSRPHTGIGADGLVLIGPPSGEGDFSMRIFNADGSEAMMCGNASRCVGKYLYEYGLTGKTTIALETLSGVKTLNLHLTDGGLVESVTVDMGVPSGIHPVRLGDDYLPYVEGVFVSMGNPHLVLFVDDVSAVPLAEIGPRIERHPLFPDRVNVEFVQPLSDNRLRMRVWERGSGVTQACGTGACATVAAGVFTGRCARESEVAMDGGCLSLYWEPSGGHMLMSGPAVKVFEGEIDTDI